MPVPYRYGARSDRLRGVERDAEVRKLCWAADVLRVDLPKRRTGRPRQGERTARMNVRAAVRTNGARWHKQQTLGHPAGRQIHPCAERR